MSKKRNTLNYRLVDTGKELHVFAVTRTFNGKRVTRLGKAPKEPGNERTEQVFQLIKGDLDKRKAPRGVNA